MNSGKDQEKKLGITFHRTFSLVRSSVAKVVEMRGCQDSKFSRSSIREDTHLGSIYVEAMPRYAIGMGLLDSDKKLSNFGRFASISDPHLEQLGTQWLMHYYMSASHGPGPAFWNQLVTTRFRSGEEFSAQDIAEQIAEFYQTIEGKPLAERSARATATIFLGTYTKSDGLGRLELLQETSKDNYLVAEPQSPPVWAVGCALLDFWLAHYPDQVTANLNDLLAENGLTKLFLISRARLNALLERLQQEGFIDVYRLSPPYQVVLLNKNMEAYLEKLYGSNSDT